MEYLVVLIIFAALALARCLVYFGFGAWLVKKTGTSESLRDGAVFARAFPFKREASELRKRLTKKPPQEPG